MRNILNNIQTVLDTFMIKWKAVLKMREVCADEKPWRWATTEQHGRGEPSGFVPTDMFHMS
eukprot:2004785-Heterocapsa_arctica.AAC.1